MFTGLIEKVSRVENFSIRENGARIAFRADFDDVKIKDSICVNGACLSVVSINKDLIEADVMNQTLNVTTLKDLKKGDFINLERALKLGSRLDGHIVSGHIDCIATLKDITDDGFSKKLYFDCENELLISKGSVAINGVSLTVADVYNYGFMVSLIPQTLENTNLKYLKRKDCVNIEFDIFAKYIKKFLTPKKEITEEFLKENGF